jgi:hypothetical protein
MNSSIAIVTTLMNNDLYKKSSQLFPKNIPKYVIEGRNEMFGIDSICFMMEKLKGKGIEWLIMADEDVLFINPNGIYTIIDYMKANDFILSGVRDGGQIPNRTYSPYLINTFFSIINFKKLEAIWRKKEVLRNQYILENEFQDDLSKLKEEYDVMSLYEPYYCFYFWLKRKGEKLFFLDAIKPFDDDEKTTLIYDTIGNELLYHTWYARVYGNNEKHTKRIDKIFSILEFKNNEDLHYTYFKDKTFYLRRRLKKLLLRIEMRINKSFSFQKK